ncbi:Nitrogen permease regulator 2 [Polyrhizophydium stewartii]|uniref:Nitrogen permease regulator 2 n=1 Tax=Polyrhizophydium stewartii TaxID=2732419 RepID=A0ABR4NHC2_9FUNG
MESFPTVLAIFFCEFHPEQGPIVVYECPEGFVQQPLPPAMSLSMSNLVSESGRQGGGGGQAGQAGAAEPGAGVGLHPFQLDPGLVASPALSEALQPSDSPWGAASREAAALAVWGTQAAAGSGSLLAGNNGAVDMAARQPSAAMSDSSSAHAAGMTGGVVAGVSGGGGFAGSTTTTPLRTRSLTLQGSAQSALELGTPTAGVANANGNTNTNINGGGGSSSSSNAWSKPELDFASLSEYLIPKTDMCNRLVSISTTAYKILGYPVLINHKKYHRNDFRFNLCFVFRRGDNTSCYDQVVTKMARFLHSLELESEFVSRPETKEKLRDIVERLHEDLNKVHDCQFRVNEANTINVKLFPRYPPPAPVHDHEVPVLLLDVEAMMGKHWDLTIRRVVPHINGVNSVRRMAELADVNIKFARLAVQHLLYYGCFSNIYNVTQKISTLLESRDAQAECVRFVAKQHGQLPSFGAVFVLYCSLKASLRLTDWIVGNPTSLMTVDIR